MFRDRSAAKPVPTDSASCSAAKPVAEATRSDAPMATRKRSRSPVQTHGSKWAMDRYRYHKLALGASGTRLASRQLLRVADRTRWQSEARQKTPSALFTSIVKCVEGKCHDDLKIRAAKGPASSSAAKPTKGTASTSATKPAAVAAQHHPEFEVYANCLLYKLRLRYRC